MDAIFGLFGRKKEGEEEREEGEEGENKGENKEVTVVLLEPFDLMGLPKVRNEQTSTKRSLNSFAESASEHTHKKKGGTNDGVREDGPTLSIGMLQC